MNTHTRTRRLAVLLSLCLLAAGFQCGSSRGPKGLRQQLVDNGDRLANAVRLAQGTLEDLHAAGKVTDAQARQYAGALLRLNSYGKTAARLVRDNYDRIPQSGQLPADIRADLESILSLAEAALRELQAFTDAPLLKAASDILAAVRAVRGTLEAFK